MNKRANGLLAFRATDEPATATTTTLTGGGQRRRRRHDDIIRNDSRTGGRADGRTDGRTDWPVFFAPTIIALVDFWNGMRQWK